jgi:hypothetical protein
MHDATWTSNKVSTHLPAGLKSYRIEMSTTDIWVSHEEFQEFHFESVDVSGLPAGLEEFFLKLGIRCRRSKREIKIIGAWPPTLKKLHVHTYVYPSLPPTLTSLGISFEPWVCGEKKLDNVKCLDLVAIAAVVGPTLEEFIIHVADSSYSQDKEPFPLIKGDLSFFAVLREVKSNSNAFLSLLKPLARNNSVRFTKSFDML